MALGLAVTLFISQSLNGIDFEFWVLREMGSQATGRKHVYLLN